MAMFRKCYKCYKTCDNTVKSPIFTFSDAIHWTAQSLCRANSGPRGLCLTPLILGDGAMNRISQY